MTQWTFNENKTGYKLINGHHQFDIYEGCIGQCTVQAKDPIWAAPEGPVLTPDVKHFNGVAIRYTLDDSFDDAWQVFDTMEQAEAAMIEYVKELERND